MSWLIIGISGVSGGGKTTLAKALYESMKPRENTLILECRLVHQDDYFFPQDYKNHLWIPELKHINWDVMGALDMDKMLKDIKHILNDAPKYNSKSIKKITRGTKIKILIIEGFLIMNHAAIRNICYLKFYIDLTKEQCYDRRKDRVYDPPDVEGYFDKAVWAGHLRNKIEILKYDIELLDGMRNDLLIYIKDKVNALLGAGGGISFYYN